MKPWLVAGLPRSRTAWCAAAFGGLHEGLADSDSYLEYCSRVRAAGGDSTTVTPLLAGQIDGWRDLYGPALLVERDPEEVAYSLMHRFPGTSHSHAQLAEYMGDVWGQLCVLLPDAPVVPFHYMDDYLSDMIEHLGVTDTSRAHTVSKMVVTDMREPSDYDTDKFTEAFFNRRLH